MVAFKVKLFRAIISDFFLVVLLNVA